MIRGIHHTAISTGDMERALAFYRDLLGLELIFDSEVARGSEVGDRITALENASARGAMLKAGNAIIELFQYESPIPKQGDPARPVCDHGITHICLDVSDLDAEYERLRAGGMTFHCPPQDISPAIRTTYGRDPDGNVLELQEVLQKDHPIALDLE